MDLFEQRIAADMAAIADTLPPLGPAARQARRTPPLAPLAATVAVLTIALGAAYVATVDGPGSDEPVGPSTATPTLDPPAPTVADDTVLTQVSASLQRLESLPGFGEVNTNEDTGEITIAWSGPVPAEAVAAAEQVRASGVEVINIRSNYSSEELTAARHAILARYPYADHPHLGAVGPTDQLSGLVAEVDRAWLHGRDAAAFEDELAAIAGLPVRVRPIEVGIMPPP